MCGSLWDRKDLVEEQDSTAKLLYAYLRSVEYDGAIIIEFVDYLVDKSNGFPHLKNAAVLITRKGYDVYHKQLLASADHHEDKKYFDRGIKPRYLM